MKQDNTMPTGEQQDATKTTGLQHVMQLAMHAAPLAQHETLAPPGPVDDCRARLLAAQQCAEQERWFSAWLHQQELAAEAEAWQNLRERSRIHGEQAVTSAVESAKADIDEVTSRPSSGQRRSTGAPQLDEHSLLYIELLG